MISLIGSSEIRHIPYLGKFGTLYGILSILIILSTIIRSLFLGCCEIRHIPYLGNFGTFFWILSILLILSTRIWFLFLCSSGYVIYHIWEISILFMGLSVIYHYITTDCLYSLRIVVFFWYFFGNLRYFSLNLQ